jgi:hypothetical protein
MSDPKLLKIDKTQLKQRIEEMTQLYLAVPPHFATRLHNRSEDFALGHFYAEKTGLGAQTSKRKNQLEITFRPVTYSRE